MPAPVPALLRGADRAAFAVTLAARLRSRGVRTDLTCAESFVRALGTAPPHSRTELYWKARISLVRRHSELAAFDAVFTAVFDNALRTGNSAAGSEALAGRPRPPAHGEADPAEPPRPLPGDTRTGGELPWVTLPHGAARGAGDDEDNEDARDPDTPYAVPERLPSSLAGLVDLPFERLSPRQAAQLGEWLAVALRAWPTRRSRRSATGPGGRRIALRATLAAARRTGWEPVRPVRVRPAGRPRRVVMLCDVSRSMQAQATAYLHLMRAFAREADAEVFAFATSLTRLTAVLAHRSAEAATAGATAQVADRFGGTRIATCLRTLLASHHGGALRGAVVIVGSDGWDADPPERLAAAMARLHRRAHRVIWLNPRASAPGYAPRVASMAAALPYVDALLPAGTFGELARAVAATARCAERGAGPATPAPRPDADGSPPPGAPPAQA